MKNTQQFCESIYHKYELALETRREKQRVRFMIVQRSAAAAAVVTVAVGSSVFIIHQKDGKLPVTPGASISASKDPAGRALITTVSAGLMADNFIPNMIPPSGEVLYSSSLDELVGSEETDGALFRLSVSIYGDTEDAKDGVRAQWEQQGLSVEDPVADVPGDCIVTVDKEQIDQLAGEDFGIVARLAPAVRPEGYDRRLGDLAANWAETAGDQDVVNVMIFTVWGKASYTAVPNSDLFREEDFLSALEGLTPLPKPASSPTDSAESMALLEQYVANQTNIRTAAEAVMNDALDALCARVGLTNIRTRRAVFGMPEAPAPGEAFTWEGHCESTAYIDAYVTKAQLLALAEDSGVRYVHLVSEGYELN